MRVTSFGMNATYLSDLTNIMSKYQNLERELSTGRKLNQPSDDPTAFSSDIGTQSLLVQVKEWQDNTKSATSSMQIADSTLNTLQGVLSGIRTQLVQATTATVTNNDLQKMVPVVAQQALSVKQIANTNDGQQYIFAGTNGKQQPLTSTGVWQGNSQQETVIIGDNVTLATNVDGKSIFVTSPNAGANGETDLLTTLSDIQTHLQNGDTQSLRSDLSHLDANIDQVLTAQADLGGRMNRAQSATTQLEQMTNTLTARKGQAENADLAQVMTELSTQQTVYQAAILAGQHMILPTLADVLK